MKFLPTFIQNDIPHFTVLITSETFETFKITVTEFTKRHFALSNGNVVKITKLFPGSQLSI